MLLLSLVALPLCAVALLMKPLRFGCVFAIPVEASLVPPFSLPSIAWLVWNSCDLFRMFPLDPVLVCCDVTGCPGNVGLVVRACILFPLPFMVRPPCTILLGDDSSLLLLPSC